MKNLVVKGFILVFLFSLFLTPALAQTATQEVSIIARTYDFLPNLIVVRVNQPVRIYLTSVDTTHGFALGEFKINRQIDPGKITTIDFIPTKTGEFPFHCSVFCGWGHLGMKGKLLVVE